ncbi:ornithine carbamoyltransferase [Fredinandcohnia sp. SECRCQ15]|uniref:Ornithine carbamoyltransferase n=2 Tax=Fredinandcohnia quinoae TaxID=2918902 RepID=A0AAW5DYZ9_9BACI|nr:ornithine carbamoyltransferase [Fredinandcohnia sp. SECRCQ15]
MYILDLAIDLKEKYKQKIETPYLKGKILAMIFEKPSTRTRVSFEAGMLQLGGSALFLTSNDLQLGRGETIGDTANTLSQYVDAIMIRTFEHEKVVELANHASIPVINGLTKDFHPCQALADLLTIYEEKGTFEGSKLVYIGDGNNVAHSLLIGAAKVGLNCTIACPPNFEPMPEIISYAQEIAEQTHAKIEICHDPIHAVKDADFIYTDVWASMGQEQEKQIRTESFSSYQVNTDLVKNAKGDYQFMHCLPAKRGEEVTSEIIDGPNSIVFQQAGNRLHVQKALLKTILE